MPANNKPFDVFAQEQATCKQYATQQVSGQAEEANQRAVGAGLLTTALGAGLGAAVGGGKGAGVGAAGGAVVGSAIGASGSNHTQSTIQQQYDNAYSQCMYAKGNQVVQPPAPVVVHPTVIYAAPPPPVVYAPPPAVIYAPPPGVVYAPPPGAVPAPDPNMPAPY
ncbi:glycine zipper family protein [Telmatospirillum siberiense]|nr:glycine zipper family protein [Telmatospirillum siberiense]